METITPDLLLNAYASGYFPMAESRDSTELLWFDPPLRGLLPLDGLRIPKRLRRTVASGRFEVRVDTAFREVMRACAEPRPGHDDTWINDQIIDLYCQLHDYGFAHSIECWQEENLVGGLYGVSLGGAFFGESMFSRQTDASKVALVYLVARLRAGGFILLDTQWVTDHLSQFGAFEVPRAEYRQRLATAIRLQTDFFTLPEDAGASEILSLAEGS